MPESSIISILNKISNDKNEDRFCAILNNEESFYYMGDNITFFKISPENYEHFCTEIKKSMNAIKKHEKNLEKFRNDGCPWPTEYISSKR